MARAWPIAALTLILAACGQTVVASSDATGGACWACSPDGRTYMGGTQSLFLGETGFGQFNRSVEDTTGARIRAGLTGADPTALDIVEREAVELGELKHATPSPDLAHAVAGLTGAKGEFLEAGAARYAYVLQEAQAHPVADPCGYAGPLIPAGAENYDPRELCWWQGTLRLLDLPVS